MMVFATVGGLLSGILEGTGAAFLVAVLAFGALRLFKLVHLRLAVRARVARLNDTDTDTGTGGDPDAADRIDEERLARVLTKLAKNPIKGPRLYVDAIEVADFRCFERVTLELNHPGDLSTLALPNVNLILGDNGSGKSTLLKAIAIAALGPALESSGFVPFHLVRDGEAEALIRGRFVVDGVNGGPRRIRGDVEIDTRGDIERVKARHDLTAWEGIFDELDPAFLVIGYGVNRRVATDDLDSSSVERGRRRRRYQRIAGLFEESAVLTPLSSWLPSVDRKRREEVEELLALLLPVDTRLTKSTAADSIFQHRGVDVPYRALADGYKSFIGWVGDLLFQIDSVTHGELPLDQVGGIVLVDEVDLLLHPTWQRDIVPKLARALPNLQFVFTTHSPIVAGTLHARNIVVARESETGASHLERIDADIHGLNAEQILVSSYFELESTRAPGVQRELMDLARRATEGDDDAAVQYLRILGGRRAPLLDQKSDSVP